MTKSYALPTSFAQELLWHLDRATPGLIAYNVPRARRLLGSLDVGALRRALDALVARHEILRTTYAERNGAVMQIVAAERRVDLRVTDLGGLEPAARDIEILRLTREEAATAFDLTRDLLLRGQLLRAGKDEHVLILSTHHIASDGWSGAIMFRDLFTLYEAFRTGLAPDLPELPIQYGDFAAWQRDELQGARLDERLNYWRQQLRGPLPLLELPTDRPRPISAGFKGNSDGGTLPSDLSEAIRQLGRAHGATPYMVILAAIQTLLHRYSGQDDIIVGSPIAGRERAETEGLIGYFANTLVLRSRFDDDPSFQILLSRVRETCLGAFDHQEMPLERLMLELRNDEAIREGGLFRVVLTQLDDTPHAMALPGLLVDGMGAGNETVKFDFTFFMGERPTGLLLAVAFRTELFDSERVERLLGHLETLLTGAVADPALPVSRLPLLTPAEAAELAAGNATAQSLGAPTTMAALLAAAATRRPATPAIVCGGDELTWGELLARASQLAHHLQAQGVGPEVPVGLGLERSADLVVGMLGILLSGGAYVPLLPELPPARLLQQLAASGARVVVTVAAHRAHFPADVALCCLDTDAAQLAARPATPPPCAATPDTLAYVLFTSGSTGTPKGVAVTHANLVHYTRAIAAVLGLPLDGTGTAWQCGTVSTLAADLGYTSVFPSLVSGGTLHVLPTDVGLDAARFQAYLAAHPLDLLKITPSHFQALAGPEFAPEHLPRRWLVLGGEPCPWSLVDAVRAHSPVRVLNHYGPTETTVGATTFEVGPTDVSAWAPATVPIGRPLPNVTADVLDARQQLVPLGVPGELWLGGAGVARGYLGREDLTQERFVGPAGRRRYRTGDRVRRLPTGDIEFLGRFDTQVKVRGHRVELGEIEAVLARHPAVAQAVVLLHAEALVAYVVARTPVPEAALAAHVAQALPDYMVPSVWVPHDALPLTPNGKIDRAALPAPTTAPATIASDGAPRTDIERRLAALWAEILKKDAVGRDDNFVTLGGHSLLAIRLLGKIAKQWNVRLALRTLFEHPTIAALASVLEQGVGGADPSKTATASENAPPHLGRASREAHRRIATPDPRSTDKDQR